VRDKVKRGAAITNIGGKTLASRLSEIFEDERLVERIRSKLPYLFQLAELESSRAGKIGMEVGSLRERILIALLIYKFGEANIETEIPITEAEVDVKVFGEPVSIKTITAKRLGGVKLIWTVDAEKAREFMENYVPSCDMLLVQINWGGEGALYYMPLEAQKKVLDSMGRERYIKLPKAGTNPRGVEMSKEAMKALAEHPLTMKIPIAWEKKKIDYDAYKRWVEYWRED